MEIKNSTIYHLPTEELKKDFLTKCEKEGIKWCTGRNAFEPNSRANFGEEHCIFVTQNRKMEFGKKTYYKTSGVYQLFPIITWEIEKPNPTIIKLPNGHKIVFNEPYTIYTDGIFTGKAKCNPADEYNAATGLVLAVERYKENKSDGMWKHVFPQLPTHRFATHVMGNWIKPVTCQEAIEAWAKGKTIRCIKDNGCEFTFKGHQEYLRDEVDALDRNQITKGTWYIEEESK